MKTILTGAARPVTDANERVRKIFESRAFSAPTPRERQNKSRKTFTKPAAEVEEIHDDVALEAQAPEGEGAASEGVDTEYHERDRRVRLPAGYEPPATSAAPEQ